MGTLIEAVTAVRAIAKERRTRCLACREPLTEGNTDQLCNDECAADWHDRTAW